MLCFVHAFKIGTGNVLRLLAGIIFGVLLELVTIRQLHAYSYGIFPTMILDVQLCIGVSWVSILYGAMEFSDASSLPWPSRPILGGLLALNIDLAMDIIAIRLGMWDWGRGMGFQYFGVPYANFWTWFWVISSFSFGYRWLAHRKDWLEIYLAPLLALVTSLVWVVATNAFIVFVILANLRNLLIEPVISATLGIIFYLQPRFYKKPVPAPAFWVPFVLHLYFMMTGAISSVILKPPFLLFVSLLMFVVALSLHRPFILSTLQKIRVE